jgi:hypothetical protein
MPETVPYRPDKLLEALERHGVHYVVIGGLAAELRGSPYVTRDVDVTPSRERLNLGRLASLADVIRSKEAAGREKDRAVLPVLRQVLERSHAIERDGPEIGF